MIRIKSSPPDLSPWSNGWDHAAPWTRRDAIRFVRRQASSHYENFPVFLPLFSREQQDALAAVYAFSRLADDFADEVEFRGPGGALIDIWDAQLDACLSGQARHPVFVALAWAIPLFSIDPDLLRDLLDAFRQDRGKSRYDTFDEVLDYCRRSANPVGRIVLQVLGADHPDHRRWSDEICTALQLTNFWQDISVDALKDRIYLPREDLDAFNVSEAAILGTKNIPVGADALVAHQVRRTREVFDAGRPLLAAVPHPGGLYLKGVWLGGTTVLGMVEDLGGEAIRKRPSLRPGSLISAFVAKGLRRARGERP